MLPGPYRNGYQNQTTITITCGSTASNQPTPTRTVWRDPLDLDPRLLETFDRICRSGRELYRDLDKAARISLWRKLATSEAERKTRNDVRSRGARRPHVVGRDMHRRLQTYDDALAARMAARRVA